MNRMIISNLAYRPLRSIISVFAVAIEVTMILLIVGLVLGILEDSKDRQKGIGADVMVRPSGAGVFSALNAAPMPIAYADVIRKQPHVAAVAPVIMQTTSSVSTIEILNGIDLDTFQ